MISPELFYALVFNAFVCWGINKFTREGMVGEKIGLWSVKIFGEFWSKPVTECLPCMASVHGTYGFFLFYKGELWMLPFYLLALVGVNYITMNNLDK